MQVWHKAIFMLSLTSLNSNFSFYFTVCVAREETYLPDQSG